MCLNSDDSLCQDCGSNGGVMYKQKQPVHKRVSRIEKCSMYLLMDVKLVAVISFIIFSLRFACVCPSRHILYFHFVRSSSIAIYLPKLCYVHDVLFSNSGMVCWLFTQWCFVKIYFQLAFSFECTVTVLWCHTFCYHSLMFTLHGHYH